MARGLNTQSKDLASIIRALSGRILRLERATTVRIGATPGYTLSVDPATGNLIARSDSGTVTILATP